MVGSGGCGWVGHFFNTASGHAFFNTAVGHAYSLNTDIHEPSMYTGLLFNMELRRATGYSDRKHTGVYIENTRIITTAISHAYSSYTALQSAGSRSAGYVSARDL